MDNQVISFLVASLVICIMLIGITWLDRVFADWDQKLAEKKRKDEDKA